MVLQKISDIDYENDDSNTIALILLLVYMITFTYFLLYIVTLLQICHLIKLFYL